VYRAPRDRLGDLRSAAFVANRGAAAANRRKHGVSFEEAQSVVLDEDALLIPDEANDDEDRFILLGLSFSLRLLVVCHCYRSGLDVIRIISARPADRTERQEYDRRRTR
jgi:hypothetical protein